MKHIVFLASGGGGNLKFFHQAILSGYLKDMQLSVIADRACGSASYAQKHGIACCIIHYKRSLNAELIDLLENWQPDIIVTNWHKIIDDETVHRYSGKLINLHYSLLPAFSGLIGIEPIKRAYEQGCKFIGPTCHLVDEGVDTGKILAQSIFTTSRPLDESVTLMFRHGCLALINGIQLTLGENIISQPSESTWIHAPTLHFDERILSENFWNKVASA